MSTVIDGTVGVTTPTTGGLILQGSTSGTCTVNASAISGTAVLTMPTGTDTLVGKATTDTLTNKSIAVTQLTGTLPVANGGTGVTTSTGTGAVVLGTSPTLTTPALGTPSALVGTNISGTSNSFVAGIGVNQTWQNLTASRAINTTYTNSTGKPIVISVRGTVAGGGMSVTITVDGSVVLLGSYSASAGAGSGMPGLMVVPVGSTYKADVATFWWELR